MKALIPAGAGYTRSNLADNTVTLGHSVTPRITLANRRRHSHRHLREHAEWQSSHDSIIGSTQITRWPYSNSKATDEFLALSYHREQGLPVVIVRCFNTVGPR